MEWQLLLQFLVNHGEDSSSAVSTQEDWRVRKDVGKVEFGLVARRSFFLYYLDTVLFPKTEVDG